MGTQLQVFANYPKSSAIAGQFNIKLTEGQQGFIFTDSMNLFVEDTVSI
jgi:hypothetical protein